MLMGCCMVHDIGMIRFKHIVDPARVAHAADQNHQIQLRILFLQFLLQVVSIVFINIKHDQLRRLMAGNLTAQLASDGTAAACNEHNLILHISQNGIDIHADRFPAQQVFDLDVPQLADVDFAVYELIQSGKAAQLVEKLLETISLMIVLPASPAPMIMTEMLFLRFCSLCLRLRKKR